MGGQAHDMATLPPERRQPSGQTGCLAAALTPASGHPRADSQLDDTRRRDLATTSAPASARANRSTLGPGKPDMVTSAGAADRPGHRPDPLLSGRIRPDRRRIMRGAAHYLLIRPHAGSANRVKWRVILILYPGLRSHENSSGIAYRQRRHD